MRKSCRKKRRSKKKSRRRKQRGGMHHGDYLKHKPQEAIYYGIKEHWEMGVQQALQNGANVNISSPYKSGGQKGYRTPLIAAVQEEAPSGILQQILGDRVGRQPTIDLDFKDTITGKTALEMAKGKGPLSNKAVELITARQAMDEMQHTSLKMNRFGDKDFNHSPNAYGHDHEYSKLLPAGPFKELKTGGRRLRRKTYGKKTRRRRRKRRRRRRRKKSRRTRKKGMGKKTLKVSTKKPPLDPIPFMNPQEPEYPKNTFFDKWSADKTPLTENESAALAIFAGINNEQKGGKKRKKT